MSNRIKELVEQICHPTPRDGFIKHSLRSLIGKGDSSDLNADHLLRRCRKRSCRLIRRCCEHRGCGTLQKSSSIHIYHRPPKLQPRPADGGWDAV
jgi:hypothetical protein